jgi:hypothetical protein
MVSREDIGSNVVENVKPGVANNKDREQGEA